MTSSRNRAASRQPQPRMGAPPFVRRRRWGRRAGPTGSRSAGHPAAELVDVGLLAGGWGVGWAVGPGPLARVHGVLLLPAGRALLLARPGRPGLSGPPRRRSGQGTARRAERALMSAQRPLTVQASRWQPVQQATGRSARGCRVPARGAAGEAGPRPARTVIDNQAEGREAGQLRQPPGAWWATSRVRPRRPAPRPRRRCGPGRPRPPGRGRGGGRRHPRPRCAGGGAGSGPPGAR